MPLLQTYVLNNKLIESETEDDVGLDISVGNSTLGDSLVASTPKKQKQKPRQRKPVDPFKKPTAPKPKGPVLATCQKCGAEYRTLRYYQRHLQTHQLKELASKVPDFISIEAKCQDIGADSLNSLLCKPVVYGKLGTQFQELLFCVKENLQTNEWKDIITFLTKRFCVLLSAEKFCMPSALLNTELSVVDSILTSTSDRDYLLLKLSSFVNYSDCVCDLFVSEFVFTFGDQLLIFICRCLRSTEENNNNVESALEFDTETRQCVFYIGGSIFHRFRMFGARYSKSLKWKTIVEVIDQKILEEDFYTVLHSEELLCDEQHQKDRLWTEQINRGGLKFVKPLVQAFLLSVLKIIVHEKKADGSVLVEETLKRIVAGDPKFDWDTAIGNALNQDLSFELMIGACKKLFAVYASGEIKNIMNTTNNASATVSITLRHRVAPNK